MKTDNNKGKKGKRVYNKKTTEEKKSVDNENISVKGNFSSPPISELITEKLNISEAKPEPIKEIPLTSLNAEEFSKYKSIIGVNKNFLDKKYANKKYPIKTWEEILIKEKISI